MRTRQKCVATDTWRSLGCRTTPLEHWSRRKPTVEPRWAKQQTKKLRPKPTKINSFMSGPSLSQVVQAGRNLNSSQILCMSSLPASIKRIGPKTTEKRWRHRFPHYKSMEAFCCHGNQSFDPVCPKTLCILSPTSVMLHIKFDQDWLTGFRDIQV